MQEEQKKIEAIETQWKEKTEQAVQNERDILLMQMEDENKLKISEVESTYKMMLEEQLKNVIGYFIYEYVCACICVCAAVWMYFVCSTVIAGLLVVQALTSGTSTI